MLYLAGRRSQSKQPATLFIPRNIQILHFWFAGDSVRGLHCRCGNPLVSPKMLRVTAVRKGPLQHKTGTIYHLLSTIKIIASCTGLLLRTGHRHGQHVREHLHWQSKAELTQLFPPSLILDGIARVTKMAKNGDNSAWGGTIAHRALLGKTLKYHLIIVLHTPFLPHDNARSKNMSSRAFH